MTPRWLHVVVLPDGKVWFSLNQTHAVDRAEANGRWLKIALEHDHDLTIFVPEAHTPNSVCKPTT